jgi:hypothetical protein
LRSILKVPLWAKITYSAIALARPGFVFGVTSQYRENLGILGRRSIGFRTPVSLPSSQAAPWRPPLEPNEESQPIAAIPLEHVRRPRDTPIWKLEAALKCRSCRTPRYSAGVHMVKLTQQREIARYKWVHPDDDERR